MAWEIDKITGERRFIESDGSTEPPPAIELTSLHAMTKEQLITLIATVGGAIWGYALMDDTQKAEAARLKLYNLGMSSNEVQKVVPALDKWFDRTQGKAAQSIAMTVKVPSIANMSANDILAMRNDMARILNEDLLIIAPLPSA